MEMAGVLNGRTIRRESVVRFGYVELSHEKEQKERLLSETRRSDQRA